MFKIKNIFTLAALAGITMGPAYGGWLHFANSVVRAEEEVQKHPLKLVQSVITAEEALDPFLCVSYHSTIAQGDRGRVEATATVLHLDGETETVSFGGDVKDNSYLKCKKGPDLEAGTAVVWEFEFDDMPRLRNGDRPAEIADVSSIISTAGKPELGQTLPLGLVPPEGVAPLGLMPGEKTGWFHSTESIFQAEKNNQKHPGKLAQTLVVPAEAKKPKVCIAYSNVAEQKNKGRVVTTVSIVHADGTEESLKIAGGVKKNEFLKCKKVDTLDEGSSLDFDFKLKKMPRLKLGEEGGESAEIHGVVTASGDPLFREPPPPPPPAPAPVDSTPAPTAPAAPAPPPPAPPSTGGGSISFADEQAVHKLLKSSTKGTQLWRAKNNSPGKWVAVGPKTEVISGNKLDYNTAGVGGTIAAAVSDYERKTKSDLGSGSGLTSTEKSLLQWYSGINASGGPTSVRRDGKGRYHGEYYRPSKGARTKTVNSLTDALDWLKSEGL